MKRFSVVLLLVLFALVPGGKLAAQAPAELLHAEWGAGNRWVDVTQRVSKLIRGGELNFRVDNDALGVDPAPGVVKTLRLSVREGNGQTRQMEFKESQNVSLHGYNSAGATGAAGAAGRAGGGSGGGLHITSARYGAGNRTVDVTDRLNARIQNGQLSMQVANQTMGGDPAKNQPKTLTVRYTLNGREEQVVVNENDFFTLPGDARANAGSPRDDRGNDNNQAYGNRDDRNGNDRGYADQDNRGYGSDQGNGSRDDRGNGNGPDYRNGDNRGYDQARMERVVLPAGTELALRTNQRIDSRDVVEGQTFPAQVEEDVRDTDGSIAIPRGSNATLVTRRLEGNGDITLDVDSVIVEGRRYRVSTQDQELQNRADGVGANRRTGEYVGGGAVLGAIVGAIAGGGRGAAIGGAVGAGAGAGTQIVTRGKEVHVPAETVIRFRLDRPLRLHLWG